MLINLKENCRRGVAAVLISAFMVTGCVTTGGTSNANLSPAEQKLREQNSQMTSNVATGAALGALAGGLLALVSGNRKNAIGYAAAGAVMGGASGYYVTKRQQQYASEEQRLDSMIADAQTSNAQAKEMADTARAVIKEDMSRIDQIEKELASGKITQQTATQRLALVDDNAKLLESNIAALKKQHEQYQVASQELAKRNDVSPQTLSSYNVEVARIQDQIAMMEEELDVLMDRRGGMQGLG
ncbi:hypothetical protein [Terasakiella pusilla]|jgi:uncharacterized protein YcfJ|uniref:hypothetical protein n=1 Tax=Terasakiella pusilla TaxID=64973 RepID=UPI000490613E|nr:hypothetical protein [Terasakiella pusilla]